MGSFIVILAPLLLLLPDSFILVILVSGGTVRVLCASFLVVFVVSNFAVEGIIGV